MLKKIIFIFLFQLLIIEGFASHYMGGEITWECLTNGKYRFVMKLYRECGGGAIDFSDTEIMSIQNYPSLSSINMFRISKTDISPICNSAYTNLSCQNPGNANTGTVEEHIYTSDNQFPGGVTLSGIPPSQGWIFYYSSCCRNPCTNVSNADSKYYTLRAIMYPYNGQNENPCFDNSPSFAERPATVICTGYDFTYNHNASDKELDSLVYSWATPLEDDLTTPMSGYISGYSAMNPLPGIVHNANNVPATVNPTTGEISFKSFTQGAFVTVIKVTAYKCGIKVAEIFREMQIVLLSCGTNMPPDVSAPFQDPNTGLFSLYTDTVYAGELVTFSMASTDYDLLPNGNPQTLKLSASGLQFGASFTNSTAGCLNPPCATLNPPPPLNAMYGVSTNFNWQTTCAHVNTIFGCGVTSNVYNFVIKVQDDFCPAPAINVGTITIVVLDLPKIPSPKLSCASVDSTGKVTLTWTPVKDSVNSFDHYSIFRSNSASGPFTEITTITDINQSTFVDINANANSSNNFYYVSTISGCNATNIANTIDTLQAMKLSCFINNGIYANLAWNKLHNPELSSTNSWYKIYREYPVGNWVLIDSTQNTAFIDTVNLCKAYIDYRIELTDTSGCTSVSSISGGNIEDNTPPPIPAINYITVNQPNEKAEINWTPSTTPDVVGYVIYKKTGGVWVAIDTVFGINSDTYTNANSTANQGSESYTIAAFDSCRNISPLSVEHNTLYLTNRLSICEAKNNLTWNSYINMNPNIAGYKVIYSDNNTTYNMLESLSNTELSYVHDSIISGHEYCYYIEAYNSLNQYVSQSNIVCQTSNAPPPPSFLYLKYATVISDNSTKIAFFADTSAFTKSFNIYKSFDNGTTFEIAASLPVTTNPLHYYIDNNVSTLKSSYTYKISAIDSCDNESTVSNIGKTILLDVSALQDLKNELTWSFYEQWNTNVGLYNIYRTVDNSTYPELIGTVTQNQGTYLDDISNFVYADGKFCYFIEAIESQFNQYNFQDTSISNNICVKQFSKLYIPNAFAPGGNNGVFKPITLFIDPEYYNMKIFNRWGELIFESKDPNDGWDGTYKGSPVSSGVFVYVCMFKNQEGLLMEKKGTVTLMR
ncbi:MAG: gliding motility-associated C-terminal domain-containing protein [Bacteroidota bacterium]